MFEKLKLINVLLQNHDLPYIIEYTYIKYSIKLYFLKSIISKTPFQSEKKSLQSNFVLYLIFQIQLFIVQKLFSLALFAYLSYFNSL